MDKNAILFIIAILVSYHEYHVDGRPLYSLLKRVYASELRFNNSVLMATPDQFFFIHPSSTVLIKLLVSLIVLSGVAEMQRVQTL